ncbi:MAG: nucleotidyltransferase domain-containing protein [Candidatus Brocadiae bacterium]|nr:nucleotidyltransferase domain-containing protein [Candidatus Brocadiia bacterium]
MFSIEKYQKQIIELCNKYRIKSLYLFGSSLRKDFHEGSDVDLLVEFIRDSFSGSFDQYFGFKEELENLLKREVDLVCKNSISKNEFFQREIESTKVKLYAV